jgi:hypothetical protein
LSSGIDEKLPKFDNNGIPKTLENTTLIFMINIKLCDDYDNWFTNIFQSPQLHKQINKVIHVFLNQHCVMDSS